MTIMRRPSYLMLIQIKEADWKHKLIIPVPIFLVDAIFELRQLWPIVSKIWRKYSPESHEMMHNEMPFDIDQVMKMFLRLWRELRRAGPFTLVDVKDGDTEVKINLI